MLPTVICEPPAAPALVSVTTPVPVILPVGSVMVSGFGVIDTVAREATPVPVRATGEPVTTAPVSATVRLRVNAAAAPGANTTLIVHEATTAKAVPPLGAPAGT